MNSPKNINEFFYSEKYQALREDFEKSKAEMNLEERLAIVTEICGMSEAEFYFLRAIEDLSSLFLVSQRWEEEAAKQGWTESFRGLVEDAERATAIKPITWGEVLGAEDIESLHLVLAEETRTWVSHIGRERSNVVSEWRWEQHQKALSLAQRPSDEEAVPGPAESA